MNTIFSHSLSASLMMVMLISGFLDYGKTVLLVPVLTEC